MDGKVIAIFNAKGGVGKTASATCLADALRERGEHVLLLDMDQQHNSTDLYGAEIEGRMSTYDLLTESGVDASEGVQSTESGDIVPGDVLIRRVDQDMDKITLGRETMLRDALAKVEGAYDRIVLDCPPTIGNAALNIFMAADRVIVPMNASGEGLSALSETLEFIGKVKSNPRYNPGLEVVGVLVTLYIPGRRVSKAYDEQLPEIAERFGTRVLDTRIRFCTKYPEATTRQMTLFRYDPDCIAAQDYRAAAEEIVSKGLI